VPSSLCVLSSVVPSGLCVLSSVVPSGLCVLSSVVPSRLSLKLNHLTLELKNVKVDPVSHDCI